MPGGHALQFKVTTAACLAIIKFYGYQIRFCSTHSELSSVL